jgi:hypothetical protein
MYPHFLANLGNDTIYVPREKIEAHCEQYSTIGTLVLGKDHSEQQAPHLTCMCGIYAYKEKPRLLREIRKSNSGLRLVYGEINLWGKVIEHEDGYRAQFGYPKRLWCTPAIEPLPLKWSVRNTRIVEPAPPETWPDAVKFTATGSLSMNRYAASVAARKRPLASWIKDTEASNVIGTSAPPTPEIV